MVCTLSRSTFSWAWLAVASVALGLGACCPAAADAPATAPAATAEPAPPLAPTAPVDADRAAFERADAALGKLATTLSSHLLAAMKEGGPKAAVEVCAVKAQELTREVSKAEGIALGRATLHLRNSANAGPDWVQSWLKSQGSGKGEGKGAVVSAVREVVDTDAGRVARVIKPIVMGDKCLTCHGEVAPDVAALLAERYPNDDAHGYSAGDLRGAFWAEVPAAR